MMNTTKRIFIPERSSTGLTSSASTVGYQGGTDEKLDTGKPTKSLRSRNKLIIGTWNVRTLHAQGKLKELTHEMTNYDWHIIGLCEVRWKNFGEVSTEEGHKIYYSGLEDKHEQGVGFLVNKSIVGSVIECRPISSRIATIRLKATPFNITIIQVYAPTSSHDDNEVEELYDQLQDIIKNTPKKDILVVQGDWNAKIGKDATENWRGTVGTSCNEDSNERGLRLLEFACYNNLLVANTYGNHKQSRISTWHSPDGKTHNQIDYILVNKRFRSSINIARTRSFPGADVGSDHDLVMMTFQLHLKRLKKQSSTRLRFDLEKLKDPNIANSFKAMMGGKFAPLLTMAEEEDLDTLTAKIATLTTETASEILGHPRRKNKPWVTDSILEMCDKRREIKHDRFTPTGATEYRKINKDIKKSMKEAKENFIEDKCKNIESHLSRNNAKQAYAIIKDLTQDKHSKVAIIRDKEDKVLTEEKDILNRWSEYCSDLYNYNIQGDPTVIDNTKSSVNDEIPIIREEVVHAVKSLKSGKSAGVDNVPAELIQAGGDNMIDILHTLCNRIWKTGQWPKQWTQSLVITIPKKGNLQLCKNYRTISLISHPSKVMLKIILNRLKPMAENIIAEEQAGFRPGRSTIEQIFNLRILMEKYKDHQQDLYHVFIDFKKAFDRVWHEALWNAMHKYNIDANIIYAIENLYKNATSAVLFNGTTGEWFRTTVGVRQGCLLSPTLFNIFLEKIMTDALEHHTGTVKIGGREITNLRFADDIDGLAGTEDELINLVTNIHQACSKYGMEISCEKTKVMTNNNCGFQKDIKISNETLESVDSFKYLGANINDQGSKKEVLQRIAQSIKALVRLKRVWQDKHISLTNKIRLLRSLVISTFLYACESWTLTVYLQKKIQAFEMRCYRKLLGISYRDRITNDSVRNRIREAIGKYDDLLSIVKSRKLKWYGHVTRSSGLAKTILQGTLPGGRKRGRPQKRWEDNIQEWTDTSLDKTLRLAEDRERWRTLVRKASVAPLQLNGHGTR